MPVLQFKGKTANLDEGEYTDRDWKDDLKKLLESVV